MTFRVELIEGDINTQQAYRIMSLSPYASESRRKLERCLDQRDCLENKSGQEEMHSFDCITSKSSTNTAAKVTPMNRAPNVLPMLICGTGSCAEEDIVGCWS